MNRRSFLRSMVLGFAGITLAAKLRLDPAPAGPTADVVPRRPRYEWIMGPVLTLGEDSQTGKIQRICYGQLIDWEQTIEDNGISGPSFKVIQWAKRAPIDESEARQFAARFRDMWPVAARSQRFHPHWINPEAYRIQMSPPMQGPHQPVDQSYYDGVINDGSAQEPA